jgi:hypothetical protein
MILHNLGKVVILMLANIATTLDSSYETGAMPDQQQPKQISDKTFQQLLKSYGFNDEQVGSSTATIQEIIEQEVLNDVVTSLSDQELKVLNSLKTQSAINHFLKEKLPNLDSRITAKVDRFKQDIVNEIAKIEHEMPVLPVHPTHAEQPSASSEQSHRAMPEPVAPPKSVLPDQPAKEVLPPIQQHVPPQVDHQPSTSPPIEGPRLVKTIVNKVSPEPNPAPAATAIPPLSTTVPPSVAQSLSTTTTPTPAAAPDDFKKRWQDLLKQPPPGTATKPTAPLDASGKKKSTLPPLPPLPPLPKAGAGGSPFGGGGSPFGGGGFGGAPFGGGAPSAKDKEEKKKKREEESVRQREELRKIREKREAEDKSKIEELQRELETIATQQDKTPKDIVQSIVSTVSTDATHYDPMEYLPGEVNRLRHMLKAASARGDWQLANDVMKKIKQLTGAS